MRSKKQKTDLILLKTSPLPYSLAYLFIYDLLSKQSFFIYFFFKKRPAIADLFLVYNYFPFVVDGELLPLPPPEGFPVVLGAFTKPELFPIF